MFMTIQLHLSHTIFECDTRFMRLDSYRPPYEEDSNLLFCHPNGDTQLLKLGIVSFTHTKRRGVSV